MTHLPLIKLRLLLLMVVAPLVIRVFFYYDLPLATDEVFYWSMSIHPSWGYYNHAPLVAWLLMPLHWLGELSAFGMHSFASVFNLLTNLVLLCLLINIIGNELQGSINLKHNLQQKEILGHPAVTLFAWLLLISPISLIGGTIWTTDTPLFLFLAASVYSFHRAYNRKPQDKIIANILQWLPCGMFFGLAILSKYSAVIWGGAAFLYLLFSATKREHLAKPGPWVAFILALAFLAPVVVWNLQHGWASFSFLFQRGFDSGAPDPLGIMAGLLILFGPAVLLFMAKKYISSPKEANRDIIFLSYISYLPLGFFILLSIKFEVFFNWFIFSTIIIFMLGAFFMAKRSSPPKVTLYSHSVYHLLILAALFYVVYLPHPVLKRQFLNYEELLPRVEQLQQQYPDAYLFGATYASHAMLTYIKKMPLPYGYSDGFNNHFEYIDETIPRGADVLLFSYEDKTDKYSRFFDEIISLEPAVIHYKGKLPTEIYIVLGKNNQLGKTSNNAE